MPGRLPGPTVLDWPRNEADKLVAASVAAISRVVMQGGRDLIPALHSGASLLGGAARAFPIAHRGLFEHFQDVYLFAHLQADRP